MSRRYHNASDPKKESSPICLLFLTCTLILTGTGNVRLCWDLEDQVLDFLGRHNSLRRQSVKPVIAYRVLYRSFVRSFIAKRDRGHFLLDGCAEHHWCASESTACCILQNIYAAVTSFDVHPLCGPIDQRHGDDGSCCLPTCMFRSKGQGKIFGVKAAVSPSKGRTLWNTKLFGG